MNELLQQSILSMRASNARIINVLRFIAVSVFLLLWIWLPRDLSWAAALRMVCLFGLWAVVAGVLWWVGRTSDQRARATLFAVGLVDIPMTFGIQWNNLPGGPVDRAVASWTLAAMIGLVLLSGLALDRLRLLLSAGLAAVLTGVLQWKANDSAMGMAGGLVLIALTAAICEQARRTRIHMATELCRQQVQRERLSRYFSPEIARQIAASNEGLSETGVHEVTVIFTDLRDFTPLAERMPTSDVVGLLNAYFEEMVSVVFAYGGTLDKYLGDGLMIYFGAPLPQPDHAARAVRCAVAMQERLIELNARRSSGAEGILRMGIGIHTGSALVGTVGASHRQDYTALGNTVNLAARLEQLSKNGPHDILASMATAQAAGDELSFDDLGEFQIKGMTAPVRVCTPSPRRGPAAAAVSPPGLEAV